MQYRDIEEFFSDESKLEGILENSLEMFDKIDIIGEKLRKGIITTPVECTLILQELNGIFAFLNPIYKISEVQKKNREERSYVDIKIKTEKMGNKFVSASTDREASLSVANYRRVRSIFEGYIEICKGLIGSCQSLLKSMQEEKNATI